jgi:hypothetical protein
MTEIFDSQSIVLHFPSLVAICDSQTVKDPPLTPLPQTNESPRIALVNISLQSRFVQLDLNEVIGRPKFGQTLKKVHCLPCRVCTAKPTLEGCSVSHHWLVHTLIASQHLIATSDPELPYQNRPRPAIPSKSITILPSPSLFTGDPPTKPKTDNPLCQADVCNHFERSTDCSSAQIRDPAANVTVERFAQSEKQHSEIRSIDKGMQIERPVRNNPKMPARQG